MAKNIEVYKKKLEDEKTHLLKSLSEVGQKNTTNEDDWSGKSEELDAEHSDSIDVADNIEEYESNNAIVAELEVELQNVSDALKRIENGTYGICKVCEKEIEDERLSASPTAQTCKEHVNS